MLAGCVTRYKSESYMEPILHSFVYSLDYLREQIADVPEELMTAQPGGVTNHPAWTIGHLVFIAQEIGAVIGLKPWLNEEWSAQFGPGSKPGKSLAGTQASTSGRSVMSKAALLSALDAAQAKLAAAVSALTDEQLDTPFPDPSYTDVFPSVRHALTQVLLGHTAFHVGQVSVWRRAMGLATMQRSYE